MTGNDGKPEETPEEPVGAGVTGAVPASGSGPESERGEPVSEKGLEPVEVPAPSREQWAALERERDELKAQLLRKRAEFENYRRRVDRDRLKAEEDAAAEIFRALIPTLDNLERALGASSRDATSIREGVSLIHREIRTLLESHGVVTQDPTGEPFDPLKHQALAHEEVPGFAEGTIVEVFQKGYFLKDRLLRPALVKVAKGEGSRSEVHSDAVH